MKQTKALEDEKRALLEQIHSSRETYRRMLTKSETPTRGVVVDNVVNIGQMEYFPRSMTMRWIVQHPYASAAVVVAVALLGTRSAKSVISHRTGRSNRQLQGKSADMRPAVSSDAATSRRTARTRSTDFMATSNASKPRTIARSVITGLATAAAMMMRDPRKMRAAANVFAAAAGFVRARRSRQSPQRVVQTVRVKG
jgi:hypothetical protein